MATITIDKQRFLTLVGKNLTDSDIEEFLPQIKCEFEEFTSDGGITVSVTGDRPDLLSTPGIARALRGFLELDLSPSDLKLEKSKIEITIEKSVEDVRPFLVSALIENVNLDHVAIRDLMQLQEKLHFTQGRKRKKVAIGLHNADVLAFPLTYKAVSPESVSFIPLGMDVKLNLREILEQHEKGIEFEGILKGFDKYPIFIDAKDNVISFPPIINGRITTVSESTKTILVDVTGTELKDCQLVLNILCQDFSDMGFKVKSVQVNGIEFPQTAKKSLKLSVSNCNKLLGVSLSQEDLLKSLYRQKISAEVLDENSIVAFIPNYRADIFAEIDLIEEVAIGHGIRNFIPAKSVVFTKGSIGQKSKLQEDVAIKMVGGGFLELNSYLVSSKSKHEKAGIFEEQMEILNPVNNEYTCVRSSILPGLFDALSKNTHQPYPQRIFEVGETVEVDENEIELKSKTRLKLAAIACHAGSSMTEIASLLQKVLNQKVILQEFECKTFIKGRSAEVFVSGKKIGIAGEVNPQVLGDYALEMPASAFEVFID